MQQTQKIPEDITELCLPQGDDQSLGEESISTRSPLCDNQKKMEPNLPCLQRPVAQDSREQNRACDDYSVEGELPNQDQAAKTQSVLMAPLDIGNPGDSSQPSPDDNAEESPEATPKGKGAGAQDLEQAPKIIEEVAELCLPRDDKKPLQQDDIIGKEEEFSLSESLSSQKDWDMPQPLRDDEGLNNCTKQLLAMNVACKEMMYKDDEEEVSQPKSFSSRDDHDKEVQSQAHDMIGLHVQQVRKRSTENTFKIHQSKKAHVSLSVRLNTERLTNYEKFEDVKTDVSNIQTDVVSLKTDNYEINRKIAQLEEENSEFKRENFKLNKESFQLKRNISQLKRAYQKNLVDHQSLRNVVTHLQNEIISLKAEMKTSSGHDDGIAPLVTGEE